MPRGILLHVVSSLCPFIIEFPLFYPPRTHSPSLISIPEYSNFYKILIRIYLIFSKAMCFPKHYSLQNLNERFHWLQFTWHFFLVVSSLCPFINELSLLYLSHTHSPSLISIPDCSKFYKIIYINYRCSSSYSNLLNFFKCYVFSKTFFSWKS